MATDFYRALADMRSVTLHAVDAQHLYEEICRIAVTSGRALMAWVGLVSDSKVIPVAWGGCAREYTEGLDVHLPPPGTENQAEGPTAYAVIHGKPYVCNDYSSDVLTQPWRDKAAAFGVGASIAYPIFRRGHPIGALNLYFRTRGSCSNELVEVVDLMVSDLCYALEHIDEQAARINAEEAARKHESRLAEVFEVALEGIIVLDWRFRIVVFNKSASQLLGVSQADAIGQSIDRFIPPQYREAHRHHVSAFATTGKTSRQMGGVRCVEAMRADGTVFPIEASISRAGNGMDTLLTVMVRDITRLREAEQAEMARVAAEAANKAKTEFLSRISHELRTPLNAIMGFAQLIQLEDENNAGSIQHERINQILKAGQHLCVLIDETLDLARIESGHIQIQPEEVNLELLLEDALKMSSPLALQHHVLLIPIYRSSFGTRIWADPGRLLQVVLNLISNAIKYNKPDGSAAIELKKNDGTIDIIVRDTGLGMTQAQLKMLFDPFNRLGREASAIEGTGLGLIFVKQLVELMGGTLSIQSQADIGTTARVSLPQKPNTVSSLDSAQGPSLGD